VTVDKKPEISEVKFNDNAVTNGGTVSLVVKEGETPKGTVTFKVSDDKGISSVNVNGVDVSAVSGEYSRELTLSVGSNNVQIEAVDTANQKTTYSFTVMVTVDKAPVISEVKFNGDAVADGGTVSLVVKEGETPKGTVTFKVSDDNLHVVTVNGERVDPEDGVYSYEVTFDHGETEVSIIAVDKLDQLSTYSFTVKVTEDKAPVISDVKFNDNAVANGETVPLVVKEGETPKGTVTFKVSDDNLHVVTVNGERVDPEDGLYSYELTFELGETEVSIIAVDKLDQLSTYSFTVKVTEDKAPVISDVAFNGTAVTGTVSLEVKEGETATGLLTFKVTDEDLAKVTVNGEKIDPEDGFYSYELSDLAAGPHEVVIDATDKAGQLTTYSFTIVVTENAKPVISDVKLAVGGFTQDVEDESYAVTIPLPATGELSFTATDDVELAEVKVLVNGESVDATEGVYAITFNTATSYVIEIVAKDSAGQETKFSFKVEVTEDKKPVISDVKFQLGEDELEPEEGKKYTFIFIGSQLPIDATLTFEAADYEGEVETKVIVGDVETPNEDNTATFSFEEPGIYEIKIVAKDSAGQETMFSFKVEIAEDQAPVIEEVKLIVTTADRENIVSLPHTGTITVSDLTATLTFTATDDVELVEVKVNGETLDLTDGVYTKQITLQQGSNVITITAKDNENQVRTLTATVNVNVDKTPTIKDVNLRFNGEEIAPENGTSTTIVFLEIPETGTLSFTATDDNRLKSYSVYVNGEQWLYQGVIGKTVSRQIEIPLQEGENTVRITAKDSADQEKEFVFTVKVVKDQKPILSNVELVVETAGQENRVSLPHTGTITVSDLTATLTFTATDDVQLVEVTVNGATLDLTAGTYSKQLTLDDNENVITISIKDNAGQIEEFTATVNVKVDKLPEVNDVKLTIDGTEKTINDGDTIQLILKEAQLPLGATVVFEVDDDNDVAAVNMKVAESEITFSSTDPYTATFAFDSFGTYEVVITAVDDAGQVREFRFTVKVLKDTVPEITSVELAVEQAGKTATFAPENGGEIRETLSNTNATLTFTATDQVGISLTVKVNGFEASKSSTGTDLYVYNLNFVEGENTVAITAVDDAGQTASYSFTVYVTLNKLPKVENVKVVWGSETQDVQANATVSLTIAEKDLPAPVKVKFDASDREGGVSVKVTLDRNVVSTAMTATGVLHVEPQIRMTTGTHAIEIIATDDDQQTTTFAFTVVITQDSKPTISDVKLVLTGAEKTVTVMPSDTIQVITIPIPADGTLTFNASDDVETTDVEVKVNDEVLTPNNNGAYTHSFTSTGNYTISIAATDSANQTTTVSFSIRLVEDTKPEIKDVQLQVGATTIAATNGESYTATVPGLPADGKLTFTVSDEQGVATVTVKVGSATVPVTAASGGNYEATYEFTDSATTTITITAKDNAGQVHEFTFSVKLDTPPEITKVTLKIDGWEEVELEQNGSRTLGVENNATGTITVKAADDQGIATVTISVNGDTVPVTDGSVNSTYTATYDFTTATTYQIVVTVEDSMGQTAQFTSAVTVENDTASPSISNVVLHLSGAETSTTINPTSGQTNVTMPIPTFATLTFTATDDVAVNKVTVKVDENTIPVQTNGDGNYTATYSFADQGSYPITIEVYDDTNKTTIFAFTLNLAKDPQPKIQDVKLTYTATGGTTKSEALNGSATTTITISDTSATLNFTATDDIGEVVEVKVNGVPLDTATDGEYTATLALKSGINVIEITAKDDAGQTTTFTATVNVTLDKFPTISDVTLKLGDSTYNLETGTRLILPDLPENGFLSFVIADDHQLSYYEVKVNDTVVIGGNTTLTSIPMTIPIPLADGDNTISLKATDSNNQTFEFVAYVNKNKAPKIESVKITIGDDGEKVATGTVSYTGTVPVDATISFQVSDDVEVKEVKVLLNNDPITATLSGDACIASFAIEHNGIYEVVIEATDDMGATATYTFTLAVVDNVAPEITEVKLDGATVDNDGTATLNVTDVTDKTLSIKATDNVGAVSVSISGIGESAVTATYNEQTEAWEYTFEALAAGDYEIVITVKDAAGNENTFRFTLVVTEQELAG